MKKFAVALLVSFFAYAQPIVGEADSLIYEKNKVIYEGNVRLTRGDALLTANRVTIHLDENRKAKFAEAEGNAKYTEGNRRGFAEKMTYDFKEEVITLKGKARVEDGPNFVEGDEIVYYKKEDRVVVMGKKSKVRSFYVEEKDEKNRPDKRP